jgi:hypothetical protein
MCNWYYSLSTFLRVIFVIAIRRYSSIDTVYVAGTDEDIARDLLEEKHHLLLLRVAAFVSDQCFLQKKERKTGQ